MKFFVDTADVEAIRDLHELGLVDGVTTNPSLIGKSGRDFREVIAEICETTPGPVSAEVIATDEAGMLEQGRALAKIASNVVVKLPLTLDGLKACRAKVTVRFQAVAKADPQNGDHHRAEGLPRVGLRRGRGGESSG